LIEKRREEARRNAMTPAERDAEDKELERWSEEGRARSSSTEGTSCSVTADGHRN
jgi:hypothetical protein